MKILICTPEYPPYYSSGIGNVVYYLKEQFERAGIKCITCSTMCSDIELCNGILAKRFAAFRFLYLPYFWYKARKYVKRNSAKYDLIWAHNPMPHFLKASPMKNELIITFHTILSYSLRYSKYPQFIASIVKKLEIESLKNIGDNAKIIVVSQKVGEELEEFGVDKEKIKYIPNGVDTNLFTPSGEKKMLRKKFGIPEEDLIILSLGKLKKQKQPSKLIAIFSKIKKELKNVTLVIAGRGELLDETKELVTQKKLKNVIFLGYVDEKDKPDLYACSDYYIMTSMYEGLPLTLLESMASGLPCIVSDIPNLRLVEVANCGIVVDFVDEEKAAQEIIGYLEQDNYRHAKNAREYAVKNLDWKIIAGRYLEEFEALYREVNPL
jgi:1,2-diacylglycerol 3-alpha-glucosyltransferase